MQNVKYSIVLAAIFLLASCSGSGESTGTTSASTPQDSTQNATEIDPLNADASGGPNLYQNGYMLVRATLSGNSPFGGYDKLFDYAYVFEENKITMIETDLDEADSEPETSTMLLDGNGRIIGGYYPESVVDRTVRYTLKYNEFGQVANVQISEEAILVEGSFDYEYIDSRISRVKQTSEDGTVFHELAYDASGNRTTATVPFGGDGGSFRAEYSYDDEGVLISAKMFNVFGIHVWTGSFSYDDNNNLVRVDIVFEEGFTETSTYEYAVAPQPVYNHGIMRQAINPLFPSTLFDIIK